MPKIMLINVTHAEESRVGIISDGVLSSFEVESFAREHLKGNIYRGVIQRIHPALEAAFVDIGAERNAFLPLDELCFRNLQNAPAPPPEAKGDANGNGRRRGLRIQDVLKPGDEILVQIVKEEFGTKPPTLSTFYSLPGRYLVYLPGSEDAGISRRIEGEERQRIRELIDQLHPPAGVGLIVRSAAGLDQNLGELERDLAYLQRLWDSIQHAAQHKRAPSLVYREHDLVLRNIRDYFTPDIDEIHVDNEDVYERARSFLQEVMPGKEKVLRLYRGHQPIFSHFNVEAQIESIYKRRVHLKSGGSIVIDGTEALTAIDVNSGRSNKGSSQEETAFRTNREAAAEIARQLRLRDLGGLVVIDFIDMKSSQNAGEVERILRNAMREDKARHEIGRISQFGLLEVSRQRLRPAASASSYTTCPTCEGYGLVRTTESAALVGLRKLHNRVAKGDVAHLRASFPPDVAIYLLNQKREDLAQIERRYSCRVQVVPKAEMLAHESDFEVRSKAEADESSSRSLRLGGVTEVPAPADTPEVATPAVPEEPTAASASPAAPAGDRERTQTEGEGGDRGGRRGRRRRGRRRGRGRGGQPNGLPGSQPGESAVGQDAGDPDGEENFAEENGAEFDDGVDLSSDDTDSSLAGANEAGDPVAVDEHVAAGLAVVDAESFGDVEPDPALPAESVLVAETVAAEAATVDGELEAEPVVEPTAETTGEPSTEANEAGSPSESVAGEGGDRRGPSARKRSSRGPRTNASRAKAPKSATSAPKAKAGAATKKTAAAPKKRPTRSRKPEEKQ